MREGDVLAGKYRVERVLGIGGMGVVVAAHHVQLDTKVAIKFLLPAMLDVQEAVDRFAREARAAVKITNEHVARVTDVGTLDNGAPYMVMEYLEGGDLAEWLRQRGPLSVEQAVDFVLQACVAVADAHGLGIVHRDLKPANLFCIRRSDGQFIIKVLDFGISKMGSLGTLDASSVTQTGAVMGSPLYMSPEQMQAPKSVDTQTDIWAIGVILYELLTGRVPFTGTTMAEIAVKAAMHAPAAMRDFRPDLSSALEAVVLTCLEKDRRRRFANVADLAVALLPFAPGRSRPLVERIAGILRSAGLSASAVAMPPLSPMQGTVAAPGTISPVGRTTSSRALGGRSNALVVTLVALVALASAAAFAGFRVTRTHDPETIVLPSAAATPASGRGTALAESATGSSSSEPSAPVARLASASTAETLVSAPALSANPAPPHAAPPLPTVGSGRTVVAAASHPAHPAATRPAAAPLATMAAPASTPPPESAETGDPLSRLRVK